jgi:3-oxoacyl-[acyl-carrier protein] reductase
MSEGLAGKRAFVTGASRGIGRGIALARAGADVAVSYRREADAADAVVAEIETLGRRACAVAADVRDVGAVRSAVAGAVDALGGLDVVVANAGVPTRFQPLHEVDPGYWQRVIDIDLTGVFHTLHATLPILREQRSGVILTLSSVAADFNGGNGGPYNAAKCAVNGLTITAARENAPFGIRANVIAPGFIATDLGQGLIDQHGDAILGSIPLGRAGTPDEIGELAVYLASEAGSWITGQVFRIDGGALGASARGAF